VRLSQRSGRRAAGLSQVPAATHGVAGHSSTQQWFFFNLFFFFYIQCTSLLY
jgi:hypothetical protein